MVIEVRKVDWKGTAGNHLNWRGSYIGVYIY